VDKGKERHGKMPRQKKEGDKIEKVWGEIGPSKLVKKKLVGGGAQDVGPQSDLRFGKLNTGGELYPLGN